MKKTVLGIGAAAGIAAMSSGVAQAGPAGGMGSESIARLLGEIAGEATGLGGLDPGVMPQAWLRVEPGDPASGSGAAPGVGEGDFGGALGLGGSGGLGDEPLRDLFGQTEGPRMDRSPVDPADGEGAPAVPLPGAALLGLAGLAATGLRRSR